MPETKRETMRKHRALAMLRTVSIDETGQLAFAVAWSPNQTDLPDISAEAASAVTQTEKNRLQEPPTAVPFAPTDGRKLLNHLIANAPTDDHRDYYRTLRRLLKSGGYLVYASAPINPQ